VIEGVSESSLRAAGSGAFGAASAAEAAAGRRSGRAGLEASIAAMLADGASPSEAARRAVAEHGARRKEAYALAQRLKSSRAGRADEEEEELPILRALQCYLYEAFHIDARQLQVVKAATAHAVVGTDGRIKPLTVEALPSLLEDVGMMIRRATTRAAVGGGA